MSAKSTQRHYSKAICPYYFKDISKKSTFVVIQRYTQKIISLHIMHMQRHNFSYLPRLT
jgi:hypothetical protein